MVLLCAPLAHGQDDGNRAFFIESIAGTGPDGAARALVPGAMDYKIDLELPSGLALKQSFNRSEITVEDLVFDTGISEETHSAATLALTDRTSMSFTRNETRVSDVLRDLLEHETTTTMQLTQGFGGGSSSGTFTLARSLHVEELPEENDELRTLTQSMGLDTGLAEGAHLVAGFQQRESQESAWRLRETGYNAQLTMALSGGEGLAHYDYLQRLVEGRNMQQRSLDLVAPFAVPGGTLSAEHHLQEKLTDDHEKIDRETKFVVPLGLIHEGAQASYVEVTKIRDENRNQKSELSFVTPMHLLGHDATFEHVSTETVKGDDFEDERIYRLTADFDGSSALLERIDTVKPSGEDLAHHRRLCIQSPQISLTDYMSFRARQVRKELEGEETSRLSRLALNLQPIDPLEVAASYTTHEAPGEQTRRDQDVQTMLTLADNARLSGSITEKQQREGSPEILRHLELQRDRSGDRDVDVRIGYTSFGDQEEEAGSGLLAEVSMGDQAALGLSASYSEFHEKKMKPLEDATTNLELRAGDPASLGFRAGYSDEAGRPEPERSIGFAMNAIGGALKLDYIRNPLGPRGRDVMVSDVYELGFKRSVMGSVAMDLGYRYFVPRDEGPFDRDHYFKLRLDGGEVAGGGKIALSYLSGHFVPYPKRGDPPASLLDLTYEKRWRDDGRVSVSLSREEPPELSVGEEENFEAEVKYETRF